MNTKVVPVLALSAMCHTNAFSEEASLSLGAFMTNKSPVYQGGESQNSPYPFIDAHWGPLFISNGQAGSFIAGSDQWGLALAIGLADIEDKSRDDSKQLKGMHKLNTVIVGTVQSFIDTDYGQFSAGLEQDISNQHKGYAANVGYSYSLELGHWLIEPAISATWINEDISNYYYGVEKKEVTSNRAAYQPGSASYLNTEINLVYFFNRNHALALGISYSHLSNNISDSPIVNHSSTSSAMVGYVYSF